jgi:hypothetical protein
MNNHHFLFQISIIHQTLNDYSLDFQYFKTKNRILDPYAFFLAYSIILRLISWPNYSGITEFSIPSRISCHYNLALVIYCLVKLADYIVFPALFYEFILNLIEIIIFVLSINYIFFVKIKICF